VLLIEARFTWPHHSRHQRRRQQIEAMGVGELEVLRAAIKQTRGWPVAGGAVALADGEGRLPR
jgi:hypothetical protein